MYAILNKKLFFFWKYFLSSSQSLNPFQTPSVPHLRLQNFPSCVLKNKTFFSYLLFLQHYFPSSHGWWKRKKEISKFEGMLCVLSKKKRREMENLKILITFSAFNESISSSSRGNAIDIIQKKWYFSFRAKILSHLQFQFSFIFYLFFSFDVCRMRERIENRQNDTVTLLAAWILKAEGKYSAGNLYRW